MRDIIRRQRLGLTVSFLVPKDSASGRIREVVLPSSIGIMPIHSCSSCMSGREVVGGEGESCEVEKSGTIVSLHAIKWHVLELIAVAGREDVLGGGGVVLWNCRVLGGIPPVKLC